MSEKIQASLSRRDFLKASGISMAAAVSSGCRSEPGDENPGVRGEILIRNGRLIDGTGRAPQRDTFILIEDGRFKEISSSSIDVAAMTVIEAAGKTVLPGLIDMHAHLLSGGFDTISEKSMSYDPADQQRALKQMLYWGVTAVYDPVQPVDQGVRLREQVANKIFASPRLFISGPGFTAPGGWAGSSDPRARFEPKDVEEATRQIEELAAAKIEIIKLFFDDMNIAFSQSLPKLDRSLMEKIIHEAHARGMRAMVHTYDTQDHMTAIRAGADVMAHSAVTEPVDEEYVELANKSEVLYLATLSVYHDVFDERAIREFIQQDFVQKTVPQKTLVTLSSPEPLDSFEKSIKQDNIRRLYPTIEDNLRKLAESGVAIGIGLTRGFRVHFPESQCIERWS